MSAIVNPTNPFSELPNANGGFDIQGFANRENRLNGTSQRDSITGANLADVLGGLSGEDTIEGRGGNDTLLGCNNEDILDGGADDDVLQGNEGNDLLLGGTSGSDVLEGGAGNDTLHSSLNVENVTLVGEDITVAEISSTNLNQVQTGLNEVLAAIKSLLTANNGNDTLIGGSGEDLLIVADGNNTLDGGTGGDTFQFLFAEEVPNSLNKISDFQPGEDSIVIQGVADNNEANYDPNTGRISLNGQEIIQLDAGLNINADDIEFI